MISSFFFKSCKWHGSVDGNVGWLVQTEISHKLAGLKFGTYTHGAQMMTHKNIADTLSFLVRV